MMQVYIHTMRMILYTEYKKIVEDQYGEYMHSTDAIQNEHEIELAF